MLRQSVMLVGLLLVLTALALWLGGAAFGAVAWALITGLLLSAGVGFERWRYKPPRRERPGPRWQRTQERCVDPLSGRVLTVYYDPASGERQYVDEDAAGR